MVVENIIQVGNPFLRKKAKRVAESSSKETKTIINDLVDTLRFRESVGFAAPQINKGLRIFVTEIRKTIYRNAKEIDQLRVFINPKIIWLSKKQVVMYEGCGSIDNIFGPVRRPKKVIIKATDENGKFFKLKADGLLARVIQHENDHLDGIIFTDKLVDIKKIMTKEEYLNKIKIKK
jgi:peptide deformylase